MEFLGDSVLQFVVSVYLFKHFPEHHEGHLTVGLEQKRHFGTTLYQNVTTEHAKVSIRKITIKCFWSYHQGQKSQVKLDLTALQFIFFVENLLFLSFFSVAAQLSRQSSNTSIDRAWTGTGQADKLWKPGVYKTLTVFPYSISGTICSLQWISKMMVMCCSSRLS